VKDRESLEPKKTRRVWNRKDQESLEPKRPGVSGTEKDQESLEPKKIRRVWNQKDQESLDTQEGRPGECGTIRGKTRRV
jgi:hypothetical protein